MRLEAFVSAGPVIQAHLIAALTALAIGLTLYLLPKGRLPHRTLGIACATCLTVAAGTAMFITRANPGWWSVIHVFVPLTFAGLFGIVMAIRHRRWAYHRHAARGLIFGALLIPGLFALLPGRLLNVLIFGGVYT
tara:strand:- start:14522 stop:14926 length:405 start_codon:yes stop_codon:yes gene_type:complete